MLLEWVAPVVGEEPIKDWLPGLDDVDNKLNYS